MRAWREAISLGLMLLFGAALVCFPAEGSAAAQDALSLCFETVIPSLFPFFVLSSLVVQSSLPRFLAHTLAPFMVPLFGVGGAGAGALLLGLLGGYPVGARTTAELYARGEISREEGEQLLSFCNNSGPGFFLGVCGTAVFSSVRAGAYLYLIHVLSALITGLLLRRELPAPTRGKGQTAPAPVSLAAALPDAVQSSFSAITGVCAFVVFFMVLLRLLLLFPILDALPPMARAALCGVLEMTNGVTSLPPTRAGFVLCAAIMNWGGLSVHAQTRALLAPSGLSARSCFVGKLVQAAVGLPLALLSAVRLFG